ncbi:BppU family phage baseplate upper protein [Enterococcus casseliflavus]|uniref:BppU family phage baseplate upper protein n=1 Tax=Enterococcus casseliflavus TaxID=37734 RepID=UPI0022E33F41|nr:BppU family phage baseplate upper protein [Enterococcus casseliflavus]
MATITHNLTLSTTDFNLVGDIKVRQSDDETIVFDSKILEHGLVKNFDGLKPFFCLMAREITGQGVSEEPVTVYDETKGTLKYTLSANAMQMVGRNEAYFSFRKELTNGSWAEQFSTRSFFYTVEKSIYTQPFKDSNYWFTFKELYRLFNDYIESGKLTWEDFMDTESDLWKNFINQNREIIESVDPGGVVLTELIDARYSPFFEEMFPNLKQRLDHTETHFDAQLAENTSQMLKSYGLLFDGTDTLATLQSALTDIASKYSSVKFPHKAIFNITNTLYIPAGLTVDFNGAVFTSTNDIDFDSIVIAGSNVHVKNLKIVEAGHAYLSDADGLAISGAANIENVTIENVTTEGFENGIAVKTDTGFLASNINILNCNTSYGASAGLSVSNARNVVITNHNATHNALDGLKISQNTNYIKVSGGYFGYNVNPIDGYADGIDLYAGSPYIIVDGAVCDYNGGVGIHMLSGELNDPLYVGYVGNAEKNIIVVNCITRNNVVSGIDILSKVTVSATTPHPSKILISNSISEGNEYGIIMKARHVTVSGCITTGNKKYGITVAQSRYIILADNHVIANSKLSAGAYPGISISDSAYVQVDKGIINGADSDSLQDGNESALTIWHVHGIEINGADTCDNIFIDTPIITNYTGFRQVNVSNTAANPNKKIIIKLGDIGNDTTDSYYGYYGSVFYKNNRLYEKNTDLSSTAWVPKPIEKFGITDFTATAGQDSLSIPHGLGIAPTKFNAIFRAQSGDKYILYVSADATYLYAKLNSAALAGATFRVHWSASY